jgi:hypothetical protein
MEFLSSHALRNSSRPGVLITCAPLKYQSYDELLGDGVVNLW